MFIHDFVQNYIGALRRKKTCLITNIQRNSMQNQLEREIFAKQSLFFLKNLVAVALFFFFEIAVNKRNQS